MKGVPGVHRIAQADRCPDGMARRQVQAASAATRRHVEVSRIVQIEAIDFARRAESRMR
jgi:hypothetical protein